MTKNLTISISDELYAEMQKYPEVFWSVVVRDGVAQYVERHHMPQEIIDRLRKEKMEYDKRFSKA